jgi:hypothetical protein
MILTRKREPFKTGNTEGELKCYKNLLKRARRE